MRKLFLRKNLLIYIFLVLITCFALAPIIYGFSTSFKLESKAIEYPPTFIPNPFTLENYKQLLFYTPIGRYALNSLIYATASTIVVIIAGIHAAYATARFKFRAKNKLLFFILSMGFIPGITVLVPLYILSTFLGLYDTYLMPILVYSAWRLPPMIWLMKGFVENLPPALDDAALIDGCSRWGVLYRVVVPSTLSGITATALVVFVFVWNDFLTTMTLTSSSEMRTIQIGLRTYMADIGLFWGKFSAFSILAILPPLFAYFILHKQFMRGLRAMGLK